MRGAVDLDGLTIPGPTGRIRSSLANKWLGVRDAASRAGPIRRWQILIELYRTVGWSSADKPDALYSGLLASHSLVTAWDADVLIGLGNAISDGHLVVYYPHLLVLPEHRGRGVGSNLMRMLTARYSNFHQQALLADGRAIQFYKNLGFARAGATEPLWIFEGKEHN